jgi:hypothetical protein
LELVPTADGIEAQYSVDGVRTASELITLTGGAEEFARRWLTQE